MEPEVQFGHSSKDPFDAIANLTWIKCPSFDGLLPKIPVFPIRYRKLMMQFISIKDIKKSHKISPFGKNEHGIDDPEILWVVKSKARRKILFQCSTPLTPNIESKIGTLEYKKALGIRNPFDCNLQGEIEEDEDSDVE